jgi:hypothetical protein
MDGKEVSRSYEGPEDNCPHELAPRACVLCLNTEIERLERSFDAMERRAVGAEARTEAAEMRLRHWHNWYTSRLDRGLTPTEKHQDEFHITMDLESVRHATEGGDACARPAKRSTLGAPPPPADFEALTKEGTRIRQEIHEGLEGQREVTSKGMQTVLRESDRPGALRIEHAWACPKMSSDVASSHKCAGPPTCHHDAVKAAVAAARHAKTNKWRPVHLIPLSDALAALEK